MRKGQTNAPHKNAGGFLRKCCSGIATVLLVAAILLCITVMVQVTRNGFVSLGGCSLFRVVTGSMEPEIPVGSVLLTRKVPIEQIRPGDVVAYHFTQPSGVSVVVTHRVISVLKNANGMPVLETKGDANSSADGDYVDENNLIGKVIFHTNRDGITGAMNFLTSKRGFLACIFLLCLLVGFWVMGDSIKGIRNAIKGQKQNREPETEPLRNQLGQQAYEKLCSRLREELQQELAEKERSRK